jgi:hypothetical protein
MNHWSKYLKSYREVDNKHIYIFYAYFFYKWRIPSIEMVRMSEVMSEKFIV